MSLYPVLGEGSPTKTDCRKQVGTLILPSLLEDLETTCVWLKIKQEGQTAGFGTHVSTYQGKPFWNSGFLSHSHRGWFSSGSFLFVWPSLALTASDSLRSWTIGSRTQVLSGHLGESKAKEKPNWVPVPLVRFFLGGFPY